MGVEVYNRVAGRQTNQTVFGGGHAKSLANHPTESDGYIVEELVARRFHFWQTPVPMPRQLSLVFREDKPAEPTPQRKEVAESSDSVQVIAEALRPRLLAYLREIDSSNAHEITSPFFCNHHGGA